MKLIKPSAELLIQEPELEGIYKQIELAGRTCYKSTDKITEDSAKPFVDRMIKSNHLAMLEHGTVYLTITLNKPDILLGKDKNYYLYKGYDVDHYKKLIYLLKKNYFVYVIIKLMNILSYLAYLKIYILKIVN